MLKLPRAYLLSALLSCISGWRCSFLSPDESDVFILSNGYTGHVVIFFEQPNGAPEEIIDGERVFSIPATGVLFTQAAADHDWSYLPRYYYDTISRSTQITTRIDWSAYRSDSLNASLMSIGNFGTEEDKGGVQFGEFYIGTKEQIDSASERSERIGIQALYRSK